jgi:hypothetical protein
MPIPGPSLSKCNASARTLKPKDVTDLNRVIVQCAEELVLYRDDHASVEGFVTKNRRHRVEPVTQTLKHDGGDMIVGPTAFNLVSDEGARVDVSSDYAPMAKTLPKLIVVRMDARSSRRNTIGEKISQPRKHQDFLFLVKLVPKLDRKMDGASC